jgi:hypothetical protein
VCENSGPPIRICAEKLWEISDIVALIEAKEAEELSQRGPYKKQAA